MPKKQRDLCTLADEIGALERELSPLKPKLARLEDLRRTLRAHHDSEPADAVCTVQGERYVVVLGERGWENSVNVLNLAKLITAKCALKLAKVTLTALDSSPFAQFRTQCVESEQTGARSIKVFERGQDLPRTA